MIYLDNASTTKVSPSVVEAMLPYFTDQYGNPGNIHSMGLDAARAVSNARAQVAAPINADPNSIIFTSGGSEANSLAILGALDYLKEIGKTQISNFPTTARVPKSPPKANSILFHFF